VYTYKFIINIVLNSSYVYIYLYIYTNRLTRVISGHASGGGDGPRDRTGQRGEGGAGAALLGLSVKGALQLLINRYGLTRNTFR